MLYKRDSAKGFITDPPYYDASPVCAIYQIFFMYGFKESLEMIHPDIFNENLTPQNG